MFLWLYQTFVNVIQALKINLTRSLKRSGLGYVYFFFAFINIKHD
jgi:hypothetical protein